MHPFPRSWYELIRSPREFRVEGSTNSKQPGRESGPIASMRTHTVDIDIFDILSSRHFLWHLYRSWP